MMVTKSGSTLTADLHGMQVAEAKTALERLIKKAAEIIAANTVKNGAWYDYVKCKKRREKQNG